MKSSNLSRTAMFCAYPQDDMREIEVNRQANQKYPTRQRNGKCRDLKKTLKTRGLCIYFGALHLSAPCFLNSKYITKMRFQNRLKLWIYA